MSLERVMKVCALHRRPLRLAAALLALLVLTTGGVAPAQAQSEVPRVYVTDFVGYQGQVTDLVVEQITRTTRERLEADPTVQVARPIAAGGSAAAGTSPAITEATRLYETARGQYVDQRYTDAATNYTQALTFFDTNVADVTDWQMVRTLLFRLSAARFQTGQTAEAEEAMRRLLAFAPDFTLPTDDATLTPEYIERFAALSKELEKRKPGSIDTSAVEAGAEIWIDGEVRGATPMTIDKVPAGTHYVVLRKGEASTGLLATVEPGAATSLSASLQAGDAASPADALRTAVGDAAIGDDARLAARNVANRAATGHVVTALVVPLEGKAGYAVQAYVYDEELATLRALSPVVFDADLLKLNVDAYKLARAVIDAVYDGAAGEVVQGELAVTPASLAAAANVSTSTSTATATDPLGPTGEGTGTGTGTGGTSIITGIPDDDESWYENPWVWTGIGLGLAVIGGTVAAVVLLTGDEGDPQVTGFNATIEW